MGDLVLGMRLKVSGFLTEVQNELAAVTLITDECIPVAETLAKIKGEPTLNDSRIDAVVYSNVETGVNGASFDVPVFCNHAKEEPRDMNSKYLSAEVAVFIRPACHHFNHAHSVCRPTNLATCLIL